MPLKECLSLGTHLIVCSWGSRVLRQLSDPNCSKAHDRIQHVAGSLLQVNSSYGTYSIEEFNKWCSCAMPEEHWKGHMWSAEEESVTRKTPRNLVLLADIVKNYRSASLLMCKQSLLVLSSSGRAKARVARAGWPEAESPVPRWLERRWPGAPWPEAKWPGHPLPLCGKKRQEKKASSLFCGLTQLARWGQGVAYWVIRRSGASFPPAETWLPKHTYGGLWASPYLAADSVC